MNNYEKQAKTIIQKAMAKTNVDYSELKELLKEVGVYESKENIVNKINRGKISLAFALQVFEVLGIKELEL